MQHRPTLTWLDPNAAPSFPAPSTAWQAPNGLLAAGGALDPDWLLAAYRNGIFPWFDDDDGPILWWSPDPRAGQVPGAMQLSRRTRRRLRTARFRVTADQAFASVVENCARSRRTSTGTWITPNMQAAYVALHRAGAAHSIEVWQDDTLAGGIYGVAVGRVFCGESMFTRITDASKVAYFTLSEQLARWGFVLLDAQMPNPHLASLGVRPLARNQYLATLFAQRDQRSGTGDSGHWSLEDCFDSLPDYLQGQRSRIASHRPRAGS